MAVPNRVLVLRDFEETTVDIAILDAFQNLGYDRPTQHQSLAVQNFVFGHDIFIML